MNPTQNLGWQLSCVTVITNLIISHKRGNDRIKIATNGTYPWSFVTPIYEYFITGNQVMVATIKLSKLNH